MKRFLFCLFICGLSLSMRAQNVRFTAPFPSISSQTATPFLVANIPPNSPTLAVCHSPANQVPCTNYATTYTGAGVACSNGAQDTPDPNALTSACQSTGDAQGNIGFWAPAGTYDYTVCVGLNCYGPYTVTIGAMGAGTGTVTSVAVGNLSPLFTSSVATSTTTPTVSYSLSTAAGHSVLGNTSGSTGAPSYVSITTAMLPYTYSGNTTELATVTGSITAGHCAQFDASGNVVDSGGVCGGGGGGSPGGSNTQINYNNLGSFAGITNVAAGSWLASGGVTTVPSFQTKNFADVRDFSGATSDIQITNAIASLPSGGGVVNAFYTTNQTWAACPTWGGNPVNLILSPVTYTVAVNCSIPATVTLQFSQGAIFSVTTSTTTAIVGTVVAGRYKIFANALATQGTVSFAANKLTNTFYPEWWGAAKDGSTNDLAALQATSEAADTTGGGTVDLGRGNYNLGTGQWKIANAAAQHHLNVVGVNPIATQLTSSDTGSNAAIYLQSEKYVSLKNFYLHQSVQGHGVGIMMGTDTTTGTGTNGNLLEEIIIDNFGSCLSTSGGIGTSSEITFFNLQLNGCTAGFVNANFNGLDFTFIQLQMSGNTTGIDMQTSGLNVVGGSASGNGTDFLIENGGVNTITNYRSETATNFCINMQGASNLSLNGFLCQGVTNPNTHTVIQQANGFLTIENSEIGGQILIQGDTTEISIRNTQVVDPNNTYSLTTQPANMGPGFRMSFGAGSGCASGGSGLCGRFEVEQVINCNGSFGNCSSFWPNGVGWFTAGTSSIAIINNAGQQGAALTVSGNAITPTAYVHHVGAGLIKNITLPTDGTLNWQTNCIQLIADAAYTTDTTGNLAVAGTATVGQVVTWCYDLTTTKWYPNGLGGFTALTVSDPGVFGSNQTSTSAACETSFGATTLNTGATTTDTTNNCLPANAVIDAVVYRITTTITTSANFVIGDATTSGRFCGTQSTLTSGTTGICFVQADQTGAAGPRQASAAKVRVTLNANPGAGAIRLIVYYHTWTAPTS